jgi:hypothetical protein
MNAEKSYRVYEVFPNTKNDLIQINRRTRQQKKKIFKKTSAGSSKTQGESDNI